MRLSAHFRDYLADMRNEGRLTSDRSERFYSDVLYLHAQDVNERPLKAIGREDVKRTLARWSHPSTQAGRRSVLVSFYDWAMQEGLRKDNPARQTRPPKKRTTPMTRLTRPEVQQILAAAQGTLERRAVWIGICAGLRSKELLGLQGLHFQRDGFIWVSGDIAKGSHERYVPVIGDLGPIVDDIRATVAPIQFVLCAQKLTNPPLNTIYRHVPDRPMGATTLYKLAVRVGARAGIHARVHPHMWRHAFGDHIARHAGLYAAQSAMGHADVKTTEGYTGGLPLDELAERFRHVTFLGDETPLPSTPGIPVVETAGIEPAFSTNKDGISGDIKPQSPGEKDV